MDGGQRRSKNAVFIRTLRSGVGIHQQSRSATAGSDKSGANAIKVCNRLSCMVWIPPTPLLWAKGCLLKLLAVLFPQ